jgi:hypothetical protein
MDINNDQRRGDQATIESNKLDPLGAAVDWGDLSEATATTDGAGAPRIIFKERADAILGPEARR